MTTLVTGATGFVGGAIARALCAAGHQVRILVRERSSLEGLAGFSLEKVRGDVRSLDSLRDAMKGCRQVVHAAASVRLDPFAASYMEKVNVVGTKNVLAAAKACFVERLLHVSSIATVGWGTLDRPATETSEWALAGKGPYFTTKRAAEDLVLEASRRGDLEAVVINPSFVVGPVDPKPSSGFILLAVASGMVVGYPEGGTNFVDVRDVAEGARLGLEKGRAGERYILSGENLTYRQFLTMAAEELSVRPPSVLIPRKLAFSAARLGDALGPRFPKAFGFVNSHVVGTMFDVAYVSCEKARAELGYRPRPVREAVRDACKWFRETGRISAAA